jgi:beta-ketoacyl-acyl-carrier-protein synthase II
VRRVVVTGLGAVTPLGNDVASTWAGLVAGRSGIGTVTQFDPTGYAVRIGGEVRGFSTDGWIPPKEARHLDRTTKLGVVAGLQAWRDSGLEVREAEAEAVGIIFGTGAGGVRTLLDNLKVLDERGPDRVSPFLMPHFVCDTTSGVLAILLGAQGPNHAIVSACATGTHAVGEAFEIIRRGDAQVMVAGATEGASITPIFYAGFINMKALAQNNEEPERASRPFDRDRDGFVLAEGAAALVLEELEHARARGARIYCELAGYGNRNDAFHMVAQREAGEGGAKAMRAALRSAYEQTGLQPDQIDYVNAHGSATPMNDKFETLAIKSVFGAHAYRLAISSNKSMIGHAMGAAGTIEALATVLTVYHGIIPPTINLEHPDPDCDLDYVPNVAREQRVRAAISNSFGLGGHNGTLIFQRFA